MANHHYLTPEIISKLNNLSIKARFVVEGFIVGLHKSPYHGFSVEFSEHRSYGAGDEIRHIDWKLWGKTDRFFIKQYEEETNLKSYLLLDQSLSMTYNSHYMSKLEYSKVLAASLSYLMLKQQDAIGLTLFDEKIRTNIPAKSKKSHLNLILSQMQNTNPGPETKIAPVLHQAAEAIKKRGLIILMSDLFDDPEKIISGLKHFRYKGHEVIVFHILDPKEISLDFNQRTKFRDLESGQEIVTDPWHIQLDYQKNMDKFCNYIKTSCRQNNIDYVKISTELPIDMALSEYLIKRRKLS